MLVWQETERDARYWNEVYKGGVLLALRAKSIAVILCLLYSTDSLVMKLD